MSEITRLRTRLKNVQKNVTEYRMTVAEAKNLLTEIDLLISSKLEKPEVKIAPAEPRIRILDGGSF